jgi:hypothetical protein
MSKKKMTAGERIVSRTFEVALKTYCCNGMSGQKAIYDLARRIDAAIRREVKKALLAKPSDRPNPYEMARTRSRKP